MNRENKDYTVNIVDVNRFKKNRDLIMKSIESDLKIVAWICWGLGLLFENYSYNEMFDYIESVTIDSLKENIVTLPDVIPSENSSNVVLDKYFSIKENGIVKNLLNLENETDPYTRIEAEARAFNYECHMVSWEVGNFVDTKHYRDVVPPVTVWIFPKDANIRHNQVSWQVIDVPSDSYGMNVGKFGSGVPEKTSPLFETKMFLYKFHLGNPLDIKKEFLERNDKEGRLTVLLQFFDILFNFDVSQDERLRLLGENFNLKGKYISMEAKAMAEIATMINNLVNNRYANIVSENEELKKEILELKGYKKEAQELREKYNEVLKQLQQKESGDN